MANAAPQDDLKALVESGRSAEAYELGRKTPELLGDPTFDFYFGIAASDTGRAGEGVLALERYLLNFPENVSARLQLARSYFALGEDARAREEFESLQKLNPPADIAATIQRFLDAIRLREARYNTSAGLYLELGAGSDTNINGGVSNPNIMLPSLGPVVVGTQQTRTSDNFIVSGIGGFVSHPVAPGISLFANGSGEMRANQVTSNKQYDLGNYNLSGGLSVLEAKNLFRLGFNQGLLTLGSSRYRDSRGVSGEWQYQLDQQQSFSLGINFSDLRYLGSNELRNANFEGYTAGYRRLFAHAWQPILSVSYNAGTENVRAVARQDLSRRIDGGRVGLSFTPSAKWGVAVGYSTQNSDYRAPDAILAVNRKDRYEAVDAAVTYLISNAWSARAEANMAKNRSNVELYAFPRDVLMFKLRYEIK